MKYRYVLGKEQVSSEAEVFAAEDLISSSCSVAYSPPPPSPPSQAVDPFAENRQRRIIERMDEYHLRMRRNYLITPPRQDPFADGKSLPPPIIPQSLQASADCISANLCI